MPETGVYQIPLWSSLLLSARLLAGIARVGHSKHQLVFSGIEKIGHIKGERIRTAFMGTDHPPVHRQHAFVVYSPEMEQDPAAAPV